MKRIATPLSPKKSECAISANLPEFKIVFAASIELCHSIVLHYIA